jgi:hypothetical protein
MYKFDKMYMSQGMWHALERRQTFTSFWWESPKKRDHSVYQGIGGRMGSEWILGIMARGCGLDSTSSG